MPIQRPQFTGRADHAIPWGFGFTGCYVLLIHLCSVYKAGVLVWAISLVLGLIPAFIIACLLSLCWDAVEFLILLAWYLVHNRGKSL